LVSSENQILCRIFCGKDVAFRPTTDHVVHVNSCHVGLDEKTDQAMTERFRHYMPSHAPVWTSLGVAAPSETQRCRVEIRLTAVLPSSSRA
jgi:enamine deaminase RidA (YjgF/YER057c/UK114 family)